MFHYVLSQVEPGSDNPESPAIKQEKEDEDDDEDEEEEDEEEEEDVAGGDDADESSPMATIRTTPTDEQMVIKTEPLDEEESEPIPTGLQPVKIKTEPMVRFQKFISACLGLKRAVAFLEIANVLAFSIPFLQLLMLSTHSNLRLPLPFAPTSPSIVARTKLSPLLFQ